MNNVWVTGLTLHVNHPSCLGSSSLFLACVPRLNVMMFIVLTQLSKDAQKLGSVCVDDEA